MLKRTKIWMMAMALIFAVLAPSVPVFAAELSKETVEVPEDGEKHTVVAFGGSIAMIYPDGKMEIIANNSSGRINVMLDGEVLKGIGLITVPAQNRTNMVLEMGSYLVSGISEQQADSLKKAVADGLMNDMPVSSLSAIENQAGMQGVNAFIVGNRGELQTADGMTAPAGALSGIQVKTPEAAYQEFAEEMEEIVRKDQEAAQEERNREAAARDVQVKEDDEEDTENKDGGNDSSNGNTGACKHNWEPEDSLTVLYLTEDKDGDAYACVTPPFWRCTICKTLMWMNQNVHEHRGEEPCEYCGRFVCSASEDGRHDYVEKEYGTDSCSPLLDFEDGYCLTGTIRLCTKCNQFNSSDLSKADKHIHGDDYCEYCGFNQAGEHRPAGQELEQQE
ncbi:MAG: hypothetical protein K2N80_17260 [Lachnospiraceae bacterium]|nr:hypothetical protein [Lachnospiraceae bacterium]